MFHKIILIISTLFFDFTLSKFIQLQTENRWPFNPLIVMVHFYDPLPKNKLLENEQQTINFQGHSFKSTFDWSSYNLIIKKN